MSLSSLVPVEVPAVSLGSPRIRERQPKALPSSSGVIEERLRLAFSSAKP
jgi:hypothetical protein